MVSNGVSKSLKSILRSRLLFKFIDQATIRNQNATFIHSINANQHSDSPTTKKKAKDDDLQSAHHLVRPFLWIDGNFMRDLPVNTNCTEIKDAGRAHHDVQSDKNVTVNFTEAPLAHHLQQTHTHTHTLSWISAQQRMRIKIVFKSFAVINYVRLLVKKKQLHVIIRNILTIKEHWIYF